MARFFIDRPIFAWVIAIIIMLAGGLALFKLPISMYPNVARRRWKSAPATRVLRPRWSKTR